ATADRRHTHLVIRARKKTSERGYIRHEALRRHSHGQGHHILLGDVAFDEPVRKRLLQRFRKGGVFHVAVDGINLGIYGRQILQSNAIGLASGNALPHFVIGRGGRRKVLGRRWKRLAFVRSASIFL